MLGVFTQVALAVLAGSIARVEAATSTSLRYVMYYDMYHPSPLPDKSKLTGITHVVTAFANSSLFTTDPGGEYVPFVKPSELRGNFSACTKICMAIGGWADTAGFSLGATNDTTRKLYARNVAKTLDTLGYDCVDIDWEYPGGNGADYKQIPNSSKASEVQTFPLFLQAIKAAIGSKQLTIAVPGKTVDMIAFTGETVPVIDKTVDFVNVMTYDQMNRRDNITLYHTSLQGSVDTIKTYLSRGMTASKMNMGFAFYAKWFTTAPGVQCTQGLGCPTALLEAADGSDTGLSGAQTFEAKYFTAVPGNLSTTTDGSCGAGTFNKCRTGECCGQYGYCGTTAAYCGTACQAGYGTCNGTTIGQAFSTAMANGHYDAQRGAMWYWDSPSTTFWTWDTPSIMDAKISGPVCSLGLGGVMAWSLAEDSHDWSHLAALQRGVMGSGTACTGTNGTASTNGTTASTNGTTASPTTPVVVSAAARRGPPFALLPRWLIPGRRI